MSLQSGDRPEGDGAGHAHQVSQFALLGQRRFAPFFWTQFFGAANDNVLKIAFTGLVTFYSARFGGIDGGQAAFVISALFILPFVLFSATSGQIADKYDKARLMRLVKSLEIGIMLIAVWGFLSYSAALLYLCTFLMGLHSTLFGPVKYAYLPQHLHADELVGGNGMVEMGTFVAILVGTMIGSELVAYEQGGTLWIAAACVGMAIAGRVTAQAIPPSPADAPQLVINWNPFTETWRNLMLARATRAVFLSLIGISWLWFFGAIFLTSFFSFAKDVLGGGPQVVTLLLAVFSIGIGTGSLLCERLAGAKVEIGLVPFGSIGMTVFAVDLYFASHALAPSGLTNVTGFLGNPATAFAHWRVVVDMFLLAMFAGFYSVPLYALIQSRCEPHHRARIIAANNILNALFIIVSAMMAMVLLGNGLTIPQLFLVVGLLNLLVAIYIYTLVPEFLVRFLAWLLTHSLYRVSVSGQQRIPEHGAALLVCNHVSYVDAMVILSESPRPVRFVMDHQIFKLPLLSFLFRSARVIPIATTREDPAMLEQAYAHIDEALALGELVCIFPEGRITASGEISPFKNGLQRIVERRPVPVIPMALRGLWGSFFSRHGGRAFAAVPRPLRRGLSSRLELVIGKPLEPGLATPGRLQELVAALRGGVK